MSKRGRQIAIAKAQVHGIVELVRIALKSSGPCFVSSGFPRSGSTLVYNLVKIILEERYAKVFGGWDGHGIPLRENKNDCLLIKTHTLNLQYLSMADHVIFSIRDPRTCLVSCFRKFGWWPSYNEIDDWFVSLEWARGHADSVFKYEDFRNNYSVLVSELVELLDYPGDPEYLKSKLPKASSQSGGFDSETQMHGGHATNTGDADWRTALPERFSSYLEEKHFDAMKLMGYLS